MATQDERSHYARKAQLRDKLARTPMCPLCNGYDTVHGHRTEPGEYVNFEVIDRLVQDGMDFRVALRHETARKKVFMVCPRAVKHPTPPAGHEMWNFGAIPAGWELVK